MAIKIEKLFRLIRLGSDYDGGYLVCPKSVLSAACLISIGVDTNWEFEKAFLKQNPKAEIYCFDGQTSFKKTLIFFISQIIKTIAFRKEYLLLKRGFRNIFEYHSLLKKRLNFQKINIGLKGGLRLEEILLNKNKIFLKIDIEGSEYRILDTISKFEDKIEGLVVEFHDYDLHKKKIQGFISKFSLKLVYVSVNEVGNFNINNFPLVIEASFSRKPEIESKAFSTHKLDRPSNAKNELVSLDKVKL